MLGAGIVLSQATLAIKDLLLPENITLLLLLSSAPELNPIGNVGAYLRANDIEAVRSLTTRDHAKAVTS